MKVEQLVMPMSRSEKIIVKKARMDTLRAILEKKLRLVKLGLTSKDPDVRNLNKQAQARVDELKKMGVRFSEVVSYCAKG